MIDICRDHAKRAATKFICLAELHLSYPLCSIKILVENLSVAHNAIHLQAWSVSTTWKYISQTVSRCDWVLWYLHQWRRQKMLMAEHCSSRGSCVTRPHWECWVGHLDVALTTFHLQTTCRHYTTLELF